MSDEHPATILIIEDDGSLREGLALNFRHRGHEVHTAACGETGLTAAFDLRPDLIVLDLMLPVIDGMQVLEELRKRNMGIPVLILSARNALHDKVQGLRKGADDYLTKPFELPELLARADVMLRRRRQEQAQEPEIHFATVVIQPGRHRVTRHGKPVALTTREFELLLMLARRPGRVFSRDEILNLIWGWDYEGTPRTVDNLIVKLRQKLEDDPSSPRHIQTMRGIGYRMTI